MSFPSLDGQCSSSSLSFDDQIIHSNTSLSNSFNDSFSSTSNIFQRFNTLQVNQAPTLIQQQWTGIQGQIQPQINAFQDNNMYISQIQILKETVAKLQNENAALMAGKTAIEGAYTALLSWLTPATGSSDNPNASLNICIQAASLKCSLGISLTPSSKFSRSELPKVGFWMEREWKDLWKVNTHAKAIYPSWKQTWFTKKSGNAVPGKRMKVKEDPDEDFDETAHDNNAAAAPFSFTSSSSEAPTTSSSMSRPILHNTPDHEGDSNTESPVMQTRALPWIKFKNPLLSIPENQPCPINCVSNAAESAPQPSQTSPVEASGPSDVTSTTPSSRSLSSAQVQHVSPMRGTTPSPLAPISSIANAAFASEPPQTSMAETSNMSTTQAATASKKKGWHPGSNKSTQYVVHPSRALF
ncbi:hypothetical protein SCLCIDRAFT_30706 [Scleroderma citrinum Foug A]|uniref:Uncharacterized protein n=1 Tax=Scleroderma citrinum Foug A TaxID=1036808 RepID=A0A0C2YZJ9_9AGAM|nr:hypothetical protein SCLCIDRAFT_30706 [Scleroderma citrinum Foug A]